MSWHAGTLALLLGACASYEPRPLRPEDELGALRRASLADLQVVYARPGAARSEEPLTFDPTDGLDEAELVGVALTLSPSLRASRLAIGEAQALLVTAGLWPNPEISPVIRPGIGSASGSTEWGADLLFGLLRPDERPAKRAVAEAQIATTRAEIAAEELRVAAEVRSARVAVLAADHAVRILRQEVELREEALGLVRRQRELGEATQVAVALVEMERASARGLLVRARNAYESERRALNRIAGLPPEYELRLTGLGEPLTFAIHEDLSDEELDRRVLAGRFDLHASASAYEAAEQKLRLAIARQFPRVALGPSWERDLDGDAGLGLAASIEIPAFDRNQGEIAEKSAVRERLRAEYRSTVHRLRADAFEARARLRRAREEVELRQLELMPLVERAQELVEVGRRARDLTVFEWLAFRTRAVESRRDFLDSLVRHATAVVELEAATGMALSAAVGSAREDGKEQ